ncbi:MAG: glycosyl transferase [Ramlibacter sp.]|nr:glycosyl transferase [Ramlibacter sp.]
MSQPETIRIYVGADRSQQLAVRVLEYSIKRHTDATVEVHPMVDLEVPTPRDPRQGQRTGFSFSRFCIPRLAGYRGRAIYMDADMQVFRDIRELWNLPFAGRKVLVQEEVKHLAATLKLSNAPAKRIKQCAVMLLDCGRLDWDIADIVRHLDEGDYSYEQLMYDLCLLPEDDVGYTVPFEWNSLEHFDAETRLIHYTDMGTQPWVSTANPNGGLWIAEVRRMLDEGVLTLAEVKGEVDAGFFRPSLLRDLKWRHRVPRLLLPWFDRVNANIDRAGGFVVHKAVYEAKRRRKQAIKDYERRATEQAVS